MKIWLWLILMAAVAAAKIFLYVRKEIQEPSSKLFDLIVSETTKSASRIG